jgi:hypothetical protein
MGARYNPTRFHKFVGEAGSNAGLAVRMLWNRWRGRPPEAPVRNRS